MPSHKNLLACFALLLVAAAPVVRAAEEDQPGMDEDQVELVNGRALQGKIQKEDYVQIVVKSKIERKEFSFNVKSVLYAERDPAFSLGVKAREENRYTVAASYFVRALDAMKGKQKWAEDYCNYYIGEAFYAAGIFTGYTGKATGTKYDTAGTYFRRALEANPKSRFMLDIVTRLPVCLAEEGKLDEAEAALKDAEVRIKAYKEETIKINAGFSTLADMANAKVLISAGRIAELKAHAKKETWVNVAGVWQRARSNSAKFPELNQEAVDGMLRAMVNNQDFSSAKAEAQSIIDKFTKDNDARQLPLLPAAYTTLGKAWLMEAFKFEEKQQKVQANQAYAEARWNFLHVVAQFFDNDEYVAGAHYLAGVCYDKLKTVEVDTADKAIRHWKLVLQNFPRSEFADKAAEMLKASGITVATQTPANPPKQPAPKQPAPNQPEKK